VHQRGSTHPTPGHALCPRPLSVGYRVYACERRPHVVSVVIYDYRHLRTPEPQNHTAVIPTRVRLSGSPVDRRLCHSPETKGKDTFGLGQGLRGSRQHFTAIKGLGLAWINGGALKSQINARPGRFVSLSHFNKIQQNSNGNGIV